LETIPRPARPGRSVPKRTLGGAPVWGGVVWCLALRAPNAAITLVKSKSRRLVMRSPIRVPMGAACAWLLPESFGSPGLAISVVVSCLILLAGGST